MSVVEKITQLLAKKAAGTRLATLTACDYPTGRLLDEAGLDLILVGDSLGMVALGMPDTTQVTLAIMEHHTRAVRRGVKNTLLTTDLPAGTYETPSQAVESARCLVNAGADAVKLEGPGFAVIAAIVAAGIPVVAHLGMLPQQVLVEGGYHRKGRTPADAARLVEEAKGVEAAGAFALVLELVQAQVAHDISRALRIPTIGIGSGAQCDGQILVTHDLTGAFPWFRPPFAQARGDVAGEIRRAVSSYIDAVQSPRQQEGDGPP